MLSNEYFKSGPVKKGEVPRLSEEKDGQRLSLDFERRGDVWAARLRDANADYDKWSVKYKTKVLEEYYYGHQWAGMSAHHNAPYVHNEFFVAIDIKQPTLLFKRPSFTVQPKPSRTDFNPTEAYIRSELRQNTLNTIVSNIDNLGNELELTILDAFFRFGMIEVGYSADWIENPEADRPVVAVDFDESAADGEIIREPKKIPVNERMFVKRIPAENFRVGDHTASSLSRSNWCGYYEFVRSTDLYASKNIKIRSSLGYGQRSDEENTSKIWHIWDNRDKRKIIMLDSTKEIIFEKKFDRIPLIPLIFRPRLNSFYPLPLCFNWKSSQDEINENREAARTHRQAFKRKFLASEGAFNPGGLEELAAGGDGTIVKINGDPRLAISPIPVANLGAEHVQSINLSRSDFNDMAGVTQEQRGSTGTQGSRTTATQARLSDERSGVREVRDRHIVAEFLCLMGKEILLQAKEKISGDIWVSWNQDSTEDLSLMEAKGLEQAWELINTDMFGDDDFDVDITVQSLSPLGNEREKEALTEFLALLNAYPQVTYNTMLIKQIAYTVGYTNNNVIAALQKQAQMVAAGMAAEQSGSGGLGGMDGNSMSQRDAAQATPNTMDQIQQQITNQS